MPAKPLSPEQKQDAERLRKLVVAHQAKLRDQGESAAQESMTAVLGFGQSAFNQYINGKIPLNVSVLLRFAELLNVDPASISPDLAAQHDEQVRRWMALPSSARQPSQLVSTWPFENVPESLFDALTERQKGLVEAELLRAIYRIQLGAAAAPPLGEFSTPQADRDQSGQAVA